MRSADTAAGTTGWRPAPLKPPVLSRHEPGRVDNAKQQESWFQDIGDRARARAVAGRQQHQQRQSASLADGTASVVGATGSSASTTVILISSRVEQRSVLLDAVHPGVSIATFDWSCASLDAILQQLRKAFSNAPGAKRLCFVTRAKPGSISLVKGSRTTLESVNQPDIARFWQSVGLLVEFGGQIDIVGGSVGGSSDGKLLVAELQRLTTMQVNTLDSDESSGDEDGAAYEPELIDPEGRYFDYQRLSSWATIAKLHIDAQERRSRKQKGKQLHLATLEAQQLAKKLQDEDAHKSQRVQSAEDELTELRSKLAHEIALRITAENESAFAESKMASDRDLMLVANDRAQGYFEKLTKTEERLRSVTGELNVAKSKVKAMEASYEDITRQARIDALAEEGDNVADAMRTEVAEEIKALHAAKTAAEARARLAREQTRKANRELENGRRKMNLAEKRAEAAIEEKALAQKKKQYLEDALQKAEAQLDATNGTGYWRLLEPAKAQAKAATEAASKRAQSEIDEAAHFFAQKAIEAEQSTPSAQLLAQLQQELEAKMDAEDRATNFLKVSLHSCLHVDCGS